ncbi:Endonuclease/Exonuclease/phosphatase family protein [Roseobacter denitrificans OCh 114]|nr:Endonuclease/Exonuclease/phosphatase family protein [Roseobacter denitrificans OCh 114]
MVNDMMFLRHAARLRSGWFQKTRDLPDAYPESRGISKRALSKQENPHLGRARRRSRVRIAVSARSLLLTAAISLNAACAWSETLRVATFNTGLERKGPALLLRDIVRGEDAQIEAVASVLTTIAPDIVALQSFDYDLTGAALSAFSKVLRDVGLDYPYQFAALPNTGMRTDLDMDGNRRRAEARDAQGYGFFSGQGGMAILSKYPIVTDEVQDFSSMLWRDFPGALLPQTAAGPFPSEQAQAIQRLSTTGHWVVPVDVPGLGRVTLMTLHASPPVFDGPEDRNGKRNHDEIVFWQRYLDGSFGPAPDRQFVLLGDFNQDPVDGEGLKNAIRSLISDPRLQDVEPTSTGSAEATGDPFDTADWDDPVPGNMRVDYVFPSSDWRVQEAGVYWPSGPAGVVAQTASRHRLVWVDLAR